MSASAAFPGEPYETAFEIDGNLAVDGGQDWESDPAVATNLRGAPFTTLEVCDSNPVPDPNNPGEEITDDVDRIVQGNAIDGILIDSPPINSGNVNRKSDLCSVHRAWELVFVPTADPNDDPSAGQYDSVLYGGWSRPNVQGEINVLFPLLGPTSGSNADDLIVSYDFEDNTGITFVEVLDWDGDSWEPITLPAGSIEAETKDNVAGVLTGKSVRFGEFALNLTASGILPEDGPCVTYSTGDPITRTGNSPSASLMDIVDATPLTISNCGSLTINKHTRPAMPATAQSFGASTSQLDGAIIQSPDTTQIDNLLVVPDSPSVTHTDMLISPDYVVSETDIPDGWTQESLVCTAFDPITGQPVTRTLYDNGDNGPDTSFPIAPGAEAVCDITNVGPPTITLNKTTLGGSGGPFVLNAAATSGEGSVQASLTTAEAGKAVGATFEVAPGEYTIGEEDIELPGWFAGSLACALDHGEAIVVGPTNGVPPSQTFELSSGQSLVCTQTNLAAGTVDVTKTVDGPSDDWSFEFTISPVPAGQDETKTATADEPTVTWGNLQPGVEYTITESDLDGYIRGDVSCGEGGATFTPEAGEQIKCSVTNTELLPLDVQTQATASFDRTIDWSLEKSVTPATHEGTAGEEAGTSTWTVVATKTVTLGNYLVEGTVTINNDNGFAVPFSLGTTLDDGTSVDLDCDVFTVPANGTANCTFSASPTGSTATKATSLVDPTDPRLDAVSKDAAVSFAVNTLGDDTVTVDDDRDTEEQFPAEISESSTFTYDETFVCSSNPADYTESSDSDTFVNTATVTGEGTDAEDSAAVTVNCDLPEQQAPPIADIAVVKTASPTVVTPGGNVTWTLVATNNGPDAADNVTIVDNLPATLTLVSFTSPAGWDCSATVTGNPGKLSCAKATMGLNESATFTLSTTVAAAAAGTTINNIAVVSTTTGETTTSNNQDSEPITVQVAVLPPTGASHVWDRLAIAASLVLAGGLLLAIDRRRRITS